MLAKKHWKCDECGLVHDDYSDAQECCQPTVSEVYVCSECDEEHETEKAANACCAEPKEHNDAEIRAELEARGQLRLVE